MKDQAKSALQSISAFIVLVLLMFLVQIYDVSAANYGHVTVSEVRSVYDGDTFKVNIQGWPDIVGKSISVRVRGVDTPEMRGKCGEEIELARKAKKFTVSKLRNAQSVQLRNLDRGKYFRLVADVYVDGSNLSQEIIANGLGRVYTGKKRKSWCPGK